jgi:hypothetical protein
VPRRARLAIAGIPWHIIQRGNNRCACFFHEEDYRFYLEQLSTQARKFGCLGSEAYCGVIVLDEELACQVGGEFEIRGRDVICVPTKTQIETTVKPHHILNDFRR